MTESPFLSIITPSLNQRSHLEQCLANVSRMSPSVELIVADGGSTDGSAEMLQRWADNSGVGFQFFSEIDRGMYDAINKGVRASSGEVIGYVNCDDALMPWASRIVTQAFQAQPDLDWIVGDALEITGLRVAFVVQPPARLLTAQMRAGFLLPQPAVFFRRSLFERLGGFDAQYQLLGDHDFFSRALAAGARAGRAWEILAIQRMVEGQLMQKHAVEAREELRAIADQRGWGRPAFARRGVGRLRAAALHRLAILAILAGIPVGLWREASACGYFEAFSNREVLTTMVHFSRGREFARLTAVGRALFGVGG